MPIPLESKWLYPIDWPMISARVRFRRAAGACEKCGRPHLGLILQLEDGRWCDRATNVWRDDEGGIVPPPSWIERRRAVPKRVILATAHLDHDPSNNIEDNLAALCGRCHLDHDRTFHRMRRQLTLRRRKAAGDLFLGMYD